MSNSRQTTKHEVAKVFSGMADQLEDIIDKQKDRLKELKQHEQDIRQYLGEKHPGNPLKQEREAKGWLRVAVWQKYYPLKNLVEENEDILERMKRINNTSDTESSVDAEDVKGIAIDKFLEFNERNKTNCLWHHDENPSLHYYEEDNRVHCFSCGAGGDVIDVIEEVQSCSFQEALNYLSNYAP